MAKQLMRGLLLAGMTACSLPVLAEQPVDLMEVYRLAVENDAQLAAARAQLKATEEVVPQSRAGLLPEIGVSASTARNKGVNLDGAAGSDRTDVYNTHGWRASLTQPLFRLDRWFSFDQAGSISDQAKATFSKEQQDLILRVSESYFNVLRAQDNLETLKAEERAVKRQLDQTQQRYEVGLIAQTDVHEAQARYDDARVNRIVGENNVEVAFQVLWTLTDQPLHAIGGLNKEMPVELPEPADQRAWVDGAMQNNLAIQVAQYAVESAEKSIKVQKSGHAPTVDAVVSYGHDVNGGLNEGLRKNDATVYGLELNLPIFTGGLTSSKVREAEALLIKAQEDLDFTRRTSAQNTRSLFMTVSSDVQRVDARRLGIISAKSALDAVESGYEVGTRNIIDVLDAQRSLYASVRDYLNARYDFIVNTLRLKQQAGSLSPDDLGSLNTWISQIEEPSLLPKM